MPKKRAGRATWFKVFLHQKALIDAVPDENVGAALKAALTYFDTGEAPSDLDPLALAVFSSLKHDIDEAFADYQATSEKNRQNVQKRWANQGVRDDTSGNHSLQSDTEEEKEVEEEKEERENSSCSIINNSIQGENIAPPTLDDVRTYCNDNDFSFSPEKFYDYYQARGWRFGLEPIADWKALARNWERKELTDGRRNVEVRPEPIGTGRNWTVV